MLGLADASSPRSAVKAQEAAVCQREALNSVLHGVLQGVPDHGGRAQLPQVSSKGAGGDGQG